MLTDEDIKKLTKYQEMVFVTKQEFDKAMANVHESISTVQTGIDKLLKKDQTEVAEDMTLAYRMKNAENWIDKAAPKLDIEFKH